MVPTVDQLRAAFAAAEADPTVQPGPCPSWHVLLQGSHGRLAPDAVARLVDHTAACPACAAAWRTAAKTPLQAPERQNRPGGCRR